MHTHSTLGMNSHQYVIIMAGGIGSRFWPFSRQANPKQFQDILGTGKSLLQQTVERVYPICPPENVYIVTNRDYYDLVKAQLPFMRDEQILLEPVMRNTAPCIAYAAYKIYSKDPQANLVVAPADHVITKEEAFTRALQTALDKTQNSQILATLGIKPTRPDTGYGYIQVDDSQKLGELSKVKTFTEKPSLEFAKAFLESGDFVWNAGIFIGSAKTFIQAFDHYEPEIAELFGGMATSYYTAEENTVIEHVYTRCKSISIDYAIMEKAEQVYVLPCDLGWSDLGTWKSLFEVSAKDTAQNVVHGTVLSYETTNTIVKTPADRLVVIQGLDNYIVAEYGNVLLICQKDQEQRIKQFLADANQLKGQSFS